MSGVLVQLWGRIRFCDLDMHRLTVRDVKGFFDDTRKEVLCYFTAEQAETALQAFYTGGTCKISGEWFPEYQKLLVSKIDITEHKTREKAPEKVPEKAKKAHRTLDYEKMNTKYKHK